MAGGRGTRLYPTTKVVNKHLLLVYSKPMIMYPIETLKEAGITDIVISISHHNPQQFMELLGDGSEFGVNLAYAIHGEPKGISYAINHAKPWIGDESFVCLLGDNIFGDGLKTQVESFLRFRKAKDESRLNMVLLKEVGYDKAKRYGVAELDQYSNLLKVTEKPEEPPSPYIMIGAYFLTRDFFVKYPSLKPSERGEYEITDAINALMPDVTYEIYKGAWFDVGTFDSMLEASNYMKGNPLLEEWRYNVRRTLERMKE